VECVDDQLEEMMVLARILALGVAVLLAGCATVTGKSTQSLQLEVVDAQDRPVKGMECRLSHLAAQGAKEGIAGPARAFEVVVMAPARNVEVRRSGNPLQIDCRKGKEVAVATVHPRREGLEQALVPFGSVAVLIDHVSGNLYAYPTDLRLRLGQSVQLEHGEQSRVMSSERVAGAATTEEPVAATARPVVAVSVPAVRPASAAPLQAVAPVARPLARGSADPARLVAAPAPAAAAIRPASLTIAAPRVPIVSIIPARPSIAAIDTPRPAIVAAAAEHASPGTW
jgi:hypothetical protein